MLTRVVNSMRVHFNSLSGKQVSGQGEFSKRIQHRNKVFWDTADGRKLKHELISANDPIEKVKDIEYWQRRLSNKYNSREFVSMFGCRVPDLYWKGRDVQSIDFSQFPKQFVIRPTIGHSCNKVFLMNGSMNLMDKSSYTHKDLIQIMQEALDKAPYLEFLIEEFLKSEEGEYKIPKDYKFYAFNGTIARIEVINRLGPNEGSTSLYTEKWEQVENLSSKYSKATSERAPRCIDEMVAYAKQISKAYEIFVRVDFYATDKGAVFGEFTPTPGLGKVFSSKAEKMLIDYWDKYCVGMI